MNKIMIALYAITGLCAFGYTALSIVDGTFWAEGIWPLIAMAWVYNTYIAEKQSDKWFDKLQEAHTDHVDTLDGILDNQLKVETVLNRYQAVAVAANAVVNRWDTPLWKDVEPTGVVIGDLRKALKDLTDD